MFGTYRTLLALMVVALHIGGVPVIGAYAVFGFYILSGYLMTFIMQNNYGYTLSGRLRYAINRFLRIYPIYWVSIVFSVILIFFVGEIFSTDYHRSIYYPQNMKETVENILIFFPYMESPRLTPPAWALTVEIFFYILIGIGISKNKRLVLYWLVISIIYHASASFMGLGWTKRYFIIPAASLPFATGAFIYHFKYEILSRVSSISGKAEGHLPLIIFCAILANWFVGFISGHLKGIFFYTNYILCAFLVVVLSGQKKLPFITNKFDKWMGDFSYPIYLIHYQVGLIVVFVLGKMGLEYMRPDLIIMSISIPLIFIAAWIFIIIIEKPIDLMRDRVKQANKCIKPGSEYSKNLILPSSQKPKTPLLNDELYLL